MNSIRGDLEKNRDGFGISLRAMAMDIANGNTGALDVDISKILSYVGLIMGGVIISFGILATIELLIEGSSGGILTVIGGLLKSALESEIVRAIINIFLIADASVTALNKVSERTSGGIAEGVVKSLMNAFDIGVAIADDIWSIYKMFEEKAKNGKALFYFGLALTVTSTLAVILGDTLDLHGGVLEAYDIASCAIGAFGLGIMWIKRDMSPENNLPWTGLLEWIVGWAGLMSPLIKLSADAAAGWD
jgi:hypothetical protein